MKIKLLLIATCAALLTTLSAASVRAQSAANKQRVKREVAVTFDDLPATQSEPATMRYVIPKLIKSIKANGVPAIGFVNERKLYVDGKPDAGRVALLRLWLAAGLELGNHTFSHVSIDETALAEYEENVIRGEALTKGLLAERGERLRYFRHPQLRTGPTTEYKEALDKFLAERGYTVAPVTVDNNDYLFADVYARAKRRGDKATMRRVVEAYIPYMEGIFAFFEKLSVDALGYEVKQTLLLHASELNADHFDDLARMMKRRGYGFISLEDALKDRAYSLPEAQTTRGLSWLHRWMLAKGETLQMEPAEPQFITQLFGSYGR